MSDIQFDAGSPSPDAPDFKFQSGLPSGQVNVVSSPSPEGTTEDPTSVTCGGLGGIAGSGTGAKPAGRAMNYGPS